MDWGPFLVAIVPVVAMIVGWIIKMILDLTKLVAATVAKLESIDARATHQETRIDMLVSSRFSS